MTNLPAVYKQTTTISVPWVTIWSALSSRSSQMSITTISSSLTAPESLSPSLRVLRPKTTTLSLLFYCFASVSFRLNCNHVGETGNGIAFVVNVLQRLKKDDTVSADLVSKLKSDFQ